ncbi:capsule assembly Wzi family protein [Olivibacter sp. CPCC 100613]|uniref:capsule assembly Wzi family protein n=1 Tax=Olivibacter sp. CPCC 100613 TaxID=3079931 RepID=UPI002FF73FF9
MKKQNILLVYFLIATLSLKAQVLPVGTPVLEDYYRRLQLLGKLDSTISFNVRPLSNEALKQANIYDPEGSQEHSNSIYRSRDGKGMIQLMPLVWQNQINSNFPYGWNDAGMIPAAGYQTMVAAGVYAQYKFLSIQLRPEFVFAQNSNFQGFEGLDRNWWAKWYRYMNGIDAPERFGTGTYSRFFPGQSSVRLNFHPVSIGVSTESLWWGPGLRNSLLMSNNAPGFLHATINTTRPIRTSIGSFEGQLVAGRLEDSGYPPTPLGNPTHYDELYQPKPDDWRYFSGLTLSYQPKWLPGFSLGFNTVFTVNHKDMGNKLGDYLPFFPSNSMNENFDPDDINNVADQAAQDVNASVFFRWLIPEAQFEIYGEYARNDRSYDLRDLAVQLNHSRSYMFGLRKMFPVRIIDQQDLFEVAFEMTQLEQSKNADIRPTEPMYYHYIVRSGYTNLGQILGAGVGYGNNVQSLHISWLNKLKRLGVQVERLVHNNALFYDLIGDRRRNWIDLNIGAFGEYDFKRFIFQSKLIFTKAYNYQYQIGESTNLWSFRKKDSGNIHFQAGMLYRF